MHRSTTGRRRRPLIALATVLALSVIAPASASADFHLTKISEVFPGTMGFPDSAFIELQFYEPGQNNLVGHSIQLYNSVGANVETLTFPAAPTIPNGQSQRSVLAADDSPPDAVTEDITFTAMGTNIIPSGGAACFEAIPVDCVSWGNFTGEASLPGTSGTPISPGGIPNGSSLTRDITAGCATALEASDDTDSSLADFSVTADPTPRNNLTTPTEVLCGGPGGAPQTVIDKGPKKKIKKKNAKFKFSSPDAGATFECALDKKPFKACTSPLKVKVKKGKHVFNVRAVVGGTPDPSPATYKFKRKKKKK